MTKEYVGLLVTLWPKHQIHSSNHLFGFGVKIVKCVCAIAGHDRAFVIARFLKNPNYEVHFGMGKQFLENSHALNKALVVLFARFID